MFEAADLVDLSQTGPPPSSTEKICVLGSRQVSPLLLSSAASSMWEPILPTSIFASPNPRLVPLPPSPLSRTSLSPQEVEVRAFDATELTLTRPDSSVQMRAVDTHAERDTLSDLIRDVSRSREKLRVALTDFMATTEDELARMRRISGSEEDLSSKSGSGSSRGVLDVEPDSQRLQKTNERLEQECKRYQTQAAVHVKEMAQKAVLGKRHIRLLEEHDRLREKLRQAEWKFGVVLLEGEARMFHPDDLAAAYDGGARVARRIRDRVHEIWDIASKQEPLAALALHLYIDIPKVRDELFQTDTNCHDFLDGINEQDPLNIVVDALFGAPMADKIRVQLGQAIQSIQCAFILMGGPYHQYSPQLFESPADCRADKIYAIKSRASDDRWQSALGMDKIIPIPSLYPFTPEEWEGLGGRHPGAMGRRSATPPTPDVPEANLTGEDTQHASLGVLPSARTWSGGQAFVEPLSHGAVETPKATAGSLLDQYYIERENRQLREPSQLAPSQDLLNIPRDSMFKWSKIDQTSQQRLPDSERQLVIPVDIELEGSVSGSPPESDEEDPSVDVPHSAKSFVQRPTIVVQRNDDISSDANSYRTGSTARPSRSLTSSAAPSILSSTANLSGSSNETPVVSPTTPATHPPSTVHPSRRASIRIRTLDVLPHLGPHLGVTHGAQSRRKS
ncbi:hypothetical protein DB88DRAFT_539263 [Papiliotrema laurentii]|uniref:DUF7923 domain-containing protein n=1 Tax=Papiliotrema laurentii TaxID=5418 RepID=A0AAD9FTJ1_PAPLA|nr:hypothetical protein DB88DRAFT_539263 [Papiliotrema laurentii]